MKSNLTNMWRAARVLTWTLQVLIGLLDIIDSDWSIRHITFRLVCVQRRTPVLITATLVLFSPLKRSNFGSVFVFYSNTHTCTHPHTWKTKTSLKPLQNTHAPTILTSEWKLLPAVNEFGCMQRVNSLTR